MSLLLRIEKSNTNGTTTSMMTPVVSKNTTTTNITDTTTTTTTTATSTTAILEATIDDSNDDPMCLSTSVWLHNIAQLFYDHASRLIDRSASDVPASLGYYLKAYHTASLCKHTQLHSQGQSNTFIHPISIQSAPSVKIELNSDNKEYSSNTDVTKSMNLLIACAVKICQLYLREDSFIACQSWICTLDHLIEQQLSTEKSANEFMINRATRDALQRKVEEKWFGLLSAF